MCIRDRNYTHIPIGENREANNNKSYELLNKNSETENKTIETLSKQTEVLPNTEKGNDIKKKS